MMQVSIIVPAKNEAENLPNLAQRIHAALKKSKINYEIIVVDDYSTDSTSAVTLSLAKKYPVVLHKKKGKPGKAYAILEGAKKAKYATLVMIDADLQYPPEEIPAMLELGKTHGVVVANRLSRDTSLLRKISSKVNSLIFSKFLLGLHCDAQSGLKVFKKEIIEHIDLRDVSPWTLDMPLLVTARDLGYTIGCTTIHFAERAGGASKIKFVKASAEIAYGAMKLKARQKRVYDLPGGKRGSSLGAGIAYKKKRFITHTSLPHSQSALKTVTSGQKRFFLGLLGLLIVGIIVNAHSVLILLIGILTVIYFLDLVFSTYVLLKSLHFPPELSYSDEELAKLDDKTLPMYSILCPLYKESEVLPHFLDNINSIDYPKNKLDVLLLLEENDKETQDAAKALKLPSYVRVVVVPHSFPKTKPKACNYGLHFAKGEYVVIYDAEDRPDPMQLKKVYLGFQKLGDKYFCLQSKLNYYNASHNILTRLFTAEYSLWFDVILPGLQSIETTIPLGGTSNHFRTQQLRDFHAWDPFNVTEDCDLGVRLFKAGYKTAIVDSVTLEEANSNVKNWIRQRSRWIKGYFQTYLVHNRHPLQFFKTHGLQAFIFQLVIGMRISFILINPILWVATIAYFTLYSIVGPAIESLYPAPVFYMAVISLIFGNFLYFYNYMIGCAKREHWGVIKFVFLIPFYWIITSIAAGIAFYQLIVKPHYWEKTNHGLHLKKISKKTIWRSSIRFDLSSQVSFGRSLIFHKITGASLLVAATGANNIFGFLFNTYLGRNLLPADFGTLALVGSMISIVTLPVGALASTVAYRSSYLIGKYNDTAKTFWMHLRKKSLITAAAISFIWFASSPLLASMFRTDSLMPFLITAPIWLMSFLAAVDRGFLAANFSFLTLAGIVLAEAALKYVFAVVFVELGISHLVYAAIPLSMVIPFVIGWIRSRSVKSTRKLNAREITYFPTKFFNTSLLRSISSIGFLSLDIILAKYYLEPELAGYYTLLSLVGKMIYFFGQLFSQFMYPIVSRAEGASRNTLKAFLPLFFVSSLATVFGFVFFSVLGHITLPILLGDRSVHLMPYLTVYCAALTIYTISSLLVDYHQALRHYVFTYIGTFLAVLQIIALSLFHHNLSIFVNVIFVLSLVNFVMVFLMHVFYGQVIILQKNLQDLWDLISFKLNGVKPLQDGNLRILMYNWRDIQHKWAGGAEVYVHELAKYWTESGHKVTLFCGNDGTQRRNEVVDGVQIVRRGGFYTVYLWACLYYVFRFRRRFDVVVESENGVPFFTPVYSTKPKVLIVHHVHQEVFQDHLKFPFSLFARFIEKQLTPLVYRNQAVVAVSNSTRKDIIKNAIAQEGNIVIVHPGVDTKQFKRGKKTTNPSFIYLGRHKPYKNIDIAIKAFASVVKRYPKSVFTIAGNGEITWKLKQLAKELGVEKSVRFVGYVDETKKAELLRTHWVALQPSSFEGWGITVIEANAAGTPLIASNVKGLRDSVVDGVTGILIPVKNPSILARVMIETIANSKYRKELSDASYKWSQEFSWINSSEKFMNVIRTEIARRKRYVPDVNMISD